MWNSIDPCVSSTKVVDCGLTANHNTIMSTLWSTGTSLWSSTWSQSVRSAMRNSLWSWRRDWRSCLKLLLGSNQSIETVARCRCESHVLFVQSNMMAFICFVFNDRIKLCWCFFQTLHTFCVLLLTDNYIISLKLLGSNAAQYIFHMIALFHHINYTKTYMYQCVIQAFS